MFFFVNQYLLSNDSSIEHAEMKRLKLFKDHHVEAKLVTRTYDQIIHATLKRFGLTDDQLVNMYDFFAGTTTYQGHDLHVSALNLPIEYQVGTGNNYQEVKDGDRLICIVYFTGGTVGLVNHIDWFDVAGNITLRQQYDLRGFKSVDQFFGEDGQISFERYYRPDLSLYMERYYVKSVQNTPINSLNVLKNYNGKDRFFDSEEDLFAFFLDELNKANGENNIFIADRPAMAIQPVMNMQTAAKKYLWMAMNHVNDGDNLKNGPLNVMLQAPLTTELNRWDGIITMTESQAEMLRKRIGNKKPVYAINGIPVKTDLQRIDMKYRIAGQMIYVGRLGEDKQTGKLIDIFIRVHKQVPNAKLTFYGYGSPDDVNKYKKQVNDAGLTGVVVFAGYQVNLESAYNTAQLFVDTSRIDAQPLAMGEALSHGVPVVSYDYLYGPNELIESGVNGELIPLNNAKKFEKAVIKILSDPQLLQSLSVGAYDRLDGISNLNTWRQWAKLQSK
ncbi:glycosyltransferase [Limosilactobacillus fastidiosus]|uniref:Glycosyltransferase n=1 Tax=Limosilactobacillus fastidiosus TaxID=2759855 RepID=A0ABR6E829_9LACO|nr:glycosyltransferase [Limosilactobacillus fastidiosus]MBB1062448.1 glycosyltransferase [Limosilactobacillus fastidiosus]MCD7083522.1 glycosyltransferase [Limosilactobacillus fastidiosus]